MMMFAFHFVTPAASRASMILFFVCEFVAAAALAVLSKVCTPNIIITSSGAT
jgi:hypothetical protein